MSVTDPADARLLAVVADLGRASLPDIAARAGMDPREAGHRLLALSSAGWAFTLGVEADGARIRTALGGQQPASAQTAPPQQAPPQQAAPQRSGPQHSSPRSAPPHSTPQRSGPRAPHGGPPQPGPVDPVISTWGPPQSSSWTRRDAGS